MHADRGEEAAQAEPNADVTAFFFRGLGFGFVLVVHGLQLFHQRRVNGIAHIRSAVDGGVTRLGKVFVAELPGVDPSFFGGHIDERFAHRIDLRRPEAAVGSLEPVVGHAGAGERLDVGDAVAVEGDGDEVTEDDAGDNGISAMVKRNMAMTPTLKMFATTVTTNPAYLNPIYAEVRQFHSLGGTLLFGTDVGYMADYSTEGEFEALAKCGLSATDVLAMLTTNPAARMGVSNSKGTVTPGKLADLTVLDADPAASLTNFSRIRLVLRSGKLVYSHP